MIFIGHIIECWKFLTSKTTVWVIGIWIPMCQRLQKVWMIFIFFLFIIHWINTFYSFWFFSVSAISRRQYVQEKLFNQMFNELCSRQYVHRDAIEPNTEYSDKIGGKSCVGIEQQVCMFHWIFKSVPYLTESFSFNWPENVKQQVQTVRWTFECY